MSDDDQLEIFQGIDNVFVWDISGDDGLPENLEGCAAYAEVRSRLDPDSVLLYDLDPYIEGSSVVVEISPEETYDLGFTRGWTTLILTDNTGEPKDIVYTGRVKVVKSATRLVFA